MGDVVRIRDYERRAKPIEAMPTVKATILPVVMIEGLRLDDGELVDVRRLARKPE
jgi:hypothetical protein